MAEDPDRQMTIPELLEARDKIREQLLKTSTSRRSNDLRAVRRELEEELVEIETELSELGYKDPDTPVEDPE